MHLFKLEIFHSYKNLESFSHLLAFLINHLVNVGLFGQVTAQSKNYVTGVVERNLSQSQILKGIQDKIHWRPEIFLIIFRDFLVLG